MSNLQDLMEDLSKQSGIDPINGIRKGDDKIVNLLSPIGQISRSIETTGVTQSVVADRGGASGVVGTDLISDLDIRNLVNLAQHSGNLDSRSSKSISDLADQLAYLKNKFNLGGIEPLHQGNTVEMVSPRVDLQLRSPTSPSVRASTQTWAESVEMDGEASRFGGVQNSLLVTKARGMVTGSGKENIQVLGLTNVTSTGSMGGIPSGNGDIQVPMVTDIVDDLSEPSFGHSRGRGAYPYRGAVVVEVVGGSMVRVKRS